MFFSSLLLIFPKWKSHDSSWNLWENNMSWISIDFDTFDWPISLISTTIPTPTQVSMTNTFVLHVLVGMKFIIFFLIKLQLKFRTKNEKKKKKLRKKLVKFKSNPCFVSSSCLSLVLHYSHHKIKTFTFLCRWSMCPFVYLWFNQHTFVSFFSFFIALFVYISLIYRLLI